MAKNETIVIYTESKFIPEKEYTFHVIFKEILGIDYIVYDSSVSQEYKIVLPNRKTIEIRDCFFSNIPESIGYCKAKFLPEKITNLHSTVLEEDIPLLYGNQTYTEHTESIYCGGDIIGSAFFMLSRWEELITESYDRQGRFPEENACAVKYGFIKKPIVHLYAEFIRSIAAKQGYNIQPIHSFAVSLTHDIDYLYKWGKPIDFIKTCCGDIFKRLSVRAFKSSIAFRKRGDDPYDTYNKLIDLSEKNGHRSTFYLLYSKTNEWKITTNKGAEILSKIVQSDHTIGIHSNYFLEKDVEKMQDDIAFYEKLLGRKLTQNRQHFLRIRMPQTLRSLEQCGILTDSSLYYRNNPGFRTGMCIEHSLFDCEKRCTMNIKEIPLTLMDVSLQNCRKHEEALNLANDLINTVRKYNGTFVCLWHNSSFNATEWEYLDGIYEHIANTK